MLNPLDERETKEMINYRLKVAGFDSRGSLFTNDAIVEIHRYTKGYPRRISMLCHNALKALIMSNRVSVDARVIWDIINNDVKLTAVAANI
jgi:general secretion pathway protein A